MKKPKLIMIKDGETTMPSPKFGKASVEVSKEAIKRSNIIFGPVDLPTILN